MVNDAQTHTLPEDEDGLRRIAIFLGHRDLAEFAAALTARLASVEGHYARLFEEAPSLAAPGNLVFTGIEDDPDTLATIARLGFTDPRAVSQMVRGWHHGRYRATRSQRARELLTELVPVLLKEFGASSESRFCFSAPRPIAGAPAGGRPALLALHQQSALGRAARRDFGGGSAACR